MKHGSAAALAGLFLLVGCSKTEGLSSAISSLSFNPVNPPRTTVAPGTIVSVLGTNPAVLEIICSEQDALGDGVAISNSSTVAEQWTQKTSASLSLDATYKNNENAKFGANSVNNINLQLSNPSVPEMAADEVDKALARHSPLPACVDATRRALANHETVTMIYSALKADVVYTIDYDQSVSASAQTQIATDLAAQLGLQVESTGSDIIKGTGLLWGVLDDKTMIDAFLSNPKVGLTSRVPAAKTVTRVHVIPTGPVKLPH
jgi:hypothetical protein